MRTKRSLFHGEISFVTPSDPNTAQRSPKRRSPPSVEKNERATRQIRAVPKRKRREKSQIKSKNGAALRRVYGLGFRV